MPRRAIEPTATITVRLPLPLIDVLDQEVNRLRQETPGLNATRADAIRYLISLAKARLDMSAFYEPRIYSDAEMQQIEEDDTIPAKTRSWLEKRAKR
jgi:Arc/MetJ-type ribon-helix-helix transcriptional regulator